MLSNTQLIVSAIHRVSNNVSFTKSIFVQPRVDFLSHKVNAHGITADPENLAAIAEIHFQPSKKGTQGFLGALNYYSQFIQNMAVYGAVLYQLKEEDFLGSPDLEIARNSYEQLKQSIVKAPTLCQFNQKLDVHVMVFANDWALSSTLMQPHDHKLHPVRFCGRVFKEKEKNYHPAERDVLALLLLIKIAHTLLVEKQYMSIRGTQNWSGSLRPNHYMVERSASPYYCHLIT